ncbi:MULTISPECIES: DUF2169 domain-containing protein [Sorangium]|uniref:DUF2169 domain-containing protein n=1 Tax=Sorangium cellulosum TaxID=56 RepID=A0A4P2QHF3_SORCE|nr:MULTISPECIES: DUF2169 domain-containing protein [Sorangium]AUX29285.1 hypothetical protein SOCE836_013730 [Sorangium cellulosum]WCQ88675.1 hypothetical protein NQZ70_01355 [Sorangium sp. Soce836]
MVLPWTVRSARWPVAITSLGRASTATLVWGLRGQRYVTAVVKATFGLVAEGAMALGEPDPIVPGEVPDPSGVGLRSAGDLAPYLGEVDVLLTGHAEVPPTVAGEIQVRLAVVQEGALRLDRCVTLDGSAPGSEGQRRVRVDGTGPLSRRWPRREALLGAVDPRRLEGVALEVPDGLDWGYFQAAPPEQRMERLLGDEWVVLGGIVAQRPRLRTQLPGARGVARLYRREERAPREGAALSLRADTLLIDADRRCCSVVWRGYAAVGDEDLEALRVVAGVELPGEALPWVDPFAQEAREAGRTAPLPAAPSRATLPLPTQAAPVVTNVEVHPLEGTVEPLSAHVRRPATPFEARPELPPAALPASRARPGEPAIEDHPLAGTVDPLSTPAGRPTTPFEARPELPPAISAPLPSPTPTPLPSPAPAAPSGPIAAAPPLLPPELSAEPPGLGDAFLSAMTEAGAFP